MSFSPPTPGFDPTQIPVGKSPDGRPSNLVNAYSRAWMPRLAIYLTLPFMVAFVALRIYSRIRRRHKLGVDDYLCVAAAVSTFSYLFRRPETFVGSGLQCLGTGFCGVLLGQLIDNTYGRHYWDVPLSKISTTMMQETCAITALYTMTAMLIKVSLLMLFFRIFSPSSMIKSMIWAGIVFTAISYTTLFAVWLVYSVPGPNHKGWEDPAFFVHVGENTPYVSVALGALGVVSDFYVIAIPFIAISGLKLSSAKKIGVSALFATGLVACGMCVAGLVPRVQNYTATNKDGYPDPFWTSMPAYGLAVAELNLGIMCACVPVVFPLFKGMAARIASTTTSWRRYLSGYNYSGGESGATSANQKDVPERLSSKLPDGRMRTLMSFIRGKQVSQKEVSHGSISVTRATDIEMAPYSELRSVDMDYHAYLGGGLSSAHSASARGGQIETSVR